jgi:hypothetical protein
MKYPQCIFRGIFYSSFVILTQFSSPDEEDAKKRRIIIQNNFINFLVILTGAEYRSGS